MEPYVQIKIPRELGDLIDKLIEKGTLGYKSRAEFAKEAIRQKLREHPGTNIKEA